MSCDHTQVATSLIYVFFCKVGIIIPAFKIILKTRITLCLARIGPSVKGTLSVVMLVRMMKVKKNAVATEHLAKCPEHVP